MGELRDTFLALGGLFLLGLVVDLLARRVALPRVSLLLLAGVVIGPSGLDALPGASRNWFPMVAHLALVMVGFLLGGQLTRRALRGHGRVVLSVSICVSVGTAAIVAAGLALAGVPLAVALLLGGVATATAPAATADVVHEARVDGAFPEALLQIVAIDDAWGLAVFSLMLAAAEALAGGSGVGALSGGAWEIGGAVALGVALGIPMALLTGRIEPGEPTLAEALGLVLLCGGLALWLEVSFLLSAMVLGSVVANRAHHHTRPFHAIEGIEWPFLIVFFVLAGASLELASLRAAGGVLVAYVLLRSSGRVLGGFLGARLARAGPSVERWIGLALLPQAGVAVGMALVAAQQFPEHAATLLPVVIGATALFELFGPLFTRLALARAAARPKAA